MLIDFHTHHPDPDKNIYNILNYDYFNGAKLPARTPFTIGLHPWWIFQSDGFWEEKVTEIFEDDYCVGFGEIGLDRSVAIDFEIQKEFFKKQLELAHELYSPYVIIHCVRAYSDLIPFIKETSYPGPFIIHDYHGNEQITQQLLKYPCFLVLAQELCVITQFILG
jgi:TatD DNase family protein